jgi:hypothetical protein
MYTPINIDECIIKDKDTLIEVDNYGSEHNYGSEPSDSDNDSDKDRYTDVTYKKLSYNDVKKHINKSYQQDMVHRYSSALDILASYVKGQKIIYMEARAYTVSILNCLMLPSIFISAMVSILQIPLNDSLHGAIMLSALSAFVAFLLAIINYLKLDAEAEAHKISSHKYDKLQSFVEFQSGQVLLFSDPILNNDNDMDKDKDKDTGTEKYKKKLRSAAELVLIEKMRDTIKRIAERIEEIKIINQFIIPSIIRYRYSLIYNTNIFSVIKKIDDYKAKTLTDLKHVKNELRFINAMQKQKIYTYNHRAAVLFKKKQNIIHTILYLNTAFSMIDKMFQEEIDTEKLKQNNCIGFFVNDIWARFCCCFGKSSATTCCLPVEYIKAKKHDGSMDIFEKIMGFDLNEDDLHGVDLHGVDLHGVDLHGVDLHGVDLHGVDLHGVDLHGQQVQAQAQQAQQVQVQAQQVQIEEPDSLV